MKNCLVCKYHLLDIINKKLNILCCKNCGAIFLENEYYENESKYTQTESKFRQLILKFEHIPIENKIAEFYLKYLRNKTHMKFDTALDIGAGYGCFVKKLNDNYIRTEGLEYSKQKIEWSVSDKVKLNKFSENFIFEKKYDLICLTQILNYFRDTAKILENVKNNLNDNGVIFIATSNPQSKYIIQSYSDAINESYYANMLYSKKNFEDACKKNDLELTDYTVFREDVAIDFTSKNKIISYLKYILNLKKPLVLDPDGNLALILITKK